MRNFYLRNAAIFSNRFLRIVLLMLLDALIITFSLLLSFWLRFDFRDSYPLYTTVAFRLELLAWLIGIRLACGWVANIYRWSFAHASMSECANLCVSVAAGTVIFAILGHGLGVFPMPPPRSIYAMEAAFTLAGMGFLRFFPKYIFLIYRARFSERAGVAGTPMIIIGAGGSAEILARELTRTSGHGYDLVGFVDDDKSKWGSRIHGLTVLGGTADLPDLIDRYKVREILVAVPDFSGARLRLLVEICGPQQVRFKIIPPYPSVLSAGNVTKLIEDINPESLLERSLVQYDQTKVGGMLVGKTVLVTGAGGSIGSELCRQTAELGISRLVLFDLNESDLYFLHSELRTRYPDLDVRLRVGSIRDRARLDAVMAESRPNLVFHAAAHKHVPLMEDSPCEAVKNNVIGTFETAESALLHGAESFTLVSTDKAVASANIMGASKALAEFIVRGIARRGAMRCSAVRFGNVLGSNGSLLQIIKRQIAAGGPVTVTHRSMTRYFMAIPEAVTLILMATALREGETYILDMGDPVNVDRLVRQVVMLAGLTPDRDIMIKYTRPRPGEKLFEELSSGDEILEMSSFERIRVVTSREEDTRDLAEMLAEAQLIARSNDDARAAEFFRNWVPDYRPGS